MTAIEQVPDAGRELHDRIPSVPSPRVPSIGRLSRAALLALGAGGLTVSSACGAGIAPSSPPSEAGVDAAANGSPDGHAGGQGGQADGASDTGSAADGSVGSGEVSTDGGACVDLDPASYGTSCQLDSDCVAVYAGTLCAGWTCTCPQAAINASAQSSYDQAFRSVPQGSGVACECPAFGSPYCVAQQCVFCPNPMLGGTNVPGCPDGG